MKVRRLKGFIVAGTCLFTVAFGILYHFRGGDSGSSHSGIIGGEILLGIGALSLLTLITALDFTDSCIAGGMFPYPAQASIQTATKHERKYPAPSHNTGRANSCRPRHRNGPLPRVVQHRFRPGQLYRRRNLVPDACLRINEQPRQRDACCRGLRGPVHLCGKQPCRHTGPGCGCPGVYAYAEDSVHCGYLSDGAAYCVLVVY